MTYEELRQWYHEMGNPSAYELNTKEGREFKKKVKAAAQFLDSLSGEKKFSLYLKCVLEDITQPPDCPECGNQITGVRKDSFNEYCSRACMGAATVEKRKATVMDRYGVDHYAKTEECLEKTKRTSLKKYGVDHYTKTSEYKERVKATNLEKYGVEWFVETVRPEAKPKLPHAPVPMEERVARQKATFMEKYGVENAIDIPGVREKIRQTSIERYGHTSYLASPENREAVSKFFSDNRRHLVANEEHRDLLNDKERAIALYDSNNNNLSLIRRLEGINVTTMGRALREYGVDLKQHHKVSGPEYEIRKLVSDAGFSFTANDRVVLSGAEVDILVDGTGLAIEYNGIYWHSEKFKDPKYHQEKSIKAIESGIRLMHVWEDDWNNPVKRNILEKKILHKLGGSDRRIFARKTEVRPVGAKEANRFMVENHIQGAIRGALWVGLRHQDELVACMGMKRKPDGVWDLVRYATSCSVVGGMSKLLKYFKNSNEWTEIFTYAHLDYSHGDLYEKTGFEFSHITAPGLWYTKNGVRYRREKFMKHKLPKLLENFDPSLTERENMRNHGYLRIFDAGSIKYVMKNPSS